MLGELVPAACHHVERYANNRIEADHSRLKHRLRPMRGLRTDHTATVIITGLAFIQNLRRGHYELGVDLPCGLRIAAAFTELASAIWYQVRQASACPSIRQRNSAGQANRRLVGGIPPRLEAGEATRRLRTLSTPSAQ